MKFLPLARDREENLLLTASGICRNVRTASTGRVKEICAAANSNGGQSRGVAVYRSGTLIGCCNDGLKIVFHERSFSPAVIGSRVRSAGNAQF